MGKRELSNRRIWQDISGSKAEKAERSFFEVLSNFFEGTDFRVRKRPTEFKNIYNDIELSEETLMQIYNPDETWIHGVFPDFAIDNIKTKKTIYIEIKRQDGWVEDKPRKAGRGNAHERSCKFFTPGLQKIFREKGNLEEGILPVWVVFIGDITRDPKRVREITFWYGEHSGHFFMWRNQADETKLTNHFDTHIRSLLV
jgi:hypothetical protein